MSGLALIAARARRDGHRLRPRRLAVPRARPRGRDRRASIGHDAANVPDGDDVELVVSTAIGADNPERAAARERGLREIHRGALLGELSRLRRTIAIAGTHGKTTTASMAAHALLRARLGAVVRHRRRAARRPARTPAGAAGEWLVVEADESDRSFLELAPEIAVVTNIELDHHTTYASHVELEQAFAAFLRNGLRVVVADTPEAEAFLDRVGDRRRGVLRRVGDRAARRAGRASPGPASTVALSVPGAHNVANAAAALTACVIAGAEPARARGHARRLRRRRAALRAPRRDRGRARSSSTTTPTTRPRCAPRSRPPARSAAGASSPSSSRTCSRAPQLLAREFGAALALADAVGRARRLSRRASAPRTSPASAACSSPRRRPTRRAAGRSAGRRTSTRRSGCCGRRCAPATSASCSAPATSTRSAGGSSASG